MAEQRRTNVTAAIRLFREKAWLFVLVSALTGLIAFLLALILGAPLYLSSTTVYMQSTGQPGNLADYEEIIQSRTVLETVRQELNLSISEAELRHAVVVTSIPESHILKISVSYRDPTLAQRLAQQIRDSAALQIFEIMDVESVKLVDEANFPTAPLPSQAALYGILGGLLGFLLSCGVLLWRAFFVGTIQEQDLKRLGLPVLAVLPEGGQKSRWGKRLCRPGRKR